jgi:hypothetical protein
MAVLCIQRMARAWDVVARLYPDLLENRIGDANPWRGVETVHGQGATKPATREEAYALHKALIAIGQPWLAAVPLICFEWHQRPENVSAGHFRWEHFRPAERPGHVLIVHAKTGVEVAMPLADSDGLLFPELTAYLDGLPVIGDAVVLYLPERVGDTSEPRLMSRHYAAGQVRAARRRAGLPSHVTLAACRHGGLTELGDAALTEQGVMALSGHRTPDAAGLYVKRTEAQRSQAARQRRAWLGVEDAA